ncbi:hypothetical protein [Catenulispora subtropica]|uniref:PBP domain-containing protein n=1 Tax=Catenulispora subtropica TaxID=450798 RepID=A0ABN2RKM8_9ACTN
MSPRGAGAGRRRGLIAYCAAVLAWTVSFMTALVLLPPGAHTTAVAHADATSVTVAGPEQWDPASGQYGARGTVTVSQTQNLVDQVVHVSWTGFTTSSTSFVSWDDSVSERLTFYPVIVYECRGKDPKITDCYGSTHYNQDPARGFKQAQADPSAPDYPTNAGIAVTHGDHAGSVDLEVYTASQAPTLGCDATHQCSIVVEPDYGGDALGYDTADGSPDCTDHSLDADGGFNQANVQSFTQVDAADDFQAGEYCAWTHRTVVPISFAPVPAACAAGATDVAGEGTPMLDRALTQWVVGSCLAGNNPVTVNDASGLTEPQARGDFLKGAPGADLAFTSLPADPAASAARPYTYVPVGSNGIAIAFFVDDPVTHLPITRMKLNARLVAKLLTQSYDLEHVQGLKSDTPSVAGNPICLYNDPEFLALNPTDGAFTWPVCPGLDAPNTLPIVMGGKTDMVRELTTWIMSDPDARAFLSGTPDPSGMRVDGFYKTSAYPYPIDGFIPQDSSGPPVDPTTGLPYDPAGDRRDYGSLKSFEWSPIQSGLDDVLRHLLRATATCSGPVLINGVHPKCAGLHLGNRGVIAIMDTGRASAFSLPTASLLNAAGNYVAPGAPSMTAAVADYVTDAKTGTQSLPWGVAGTDYAKDANAYPLTVPAYAMAPTSGVSAAKANNIANFLSAVTDNRSGQLPGTTPGELAPGYVPNSAKQAVQAGAAIAAIRPKAAPGSGSTVTVTATGPVPTGGVTGTPTTSGSVVVTPVTVVSNGKTTIYRVTSTIGGNGNGSGDTGGAAGTGPGTTGNGGSTSKGVAGAPSGGSTRSLSGSTTPAAAAVGAAAPDTAGPARFVLPTLLVIGVVLVAAGPAGLLLSAPGGTGARIRALTSRPRPTRRFGK